MVNLSSNVPEINRWELIDRKKRCEFIRARRYINFIFLNLKKPFLTVAINIYKVVIQTKIVVCTEIEIYFGIFLCFGFTIVLFFKFVESQTSRKWIETVPQRVSRFFVTGWGAI